PTTTSRPRRRPRRAGSPKGPRSWPAGTRNSSAIWSAARRLPTKTATRRSTALTPKTSAAATALSCPRKSPASKDADTRPGAHAMQSSTGTSHGNAKGALAGMRVIELAQIMAGPTCGMMLADMGADVIKVEKINGGDDSRQYRDPLINGVSAPFLMLNRNKRAIALDLKHPEGKKILLRMIRDADVVTENFRKGTMDKLGLGYDALRKENPGLIYCAVSGYGLTGPYADKGGFD